MRPRHATWVVIAITLLAAALRFYQLGENSLWDGEIFTLLISQKDLPQLFRALREFGAHPPVWFLVTKLSDSLGWNEWMLRYPAAFVGILAVPAMYVVGRRWLNASADGAPADHSSSSRVDALRVMTGLVGALLLAVAPLAVLYAQVGRMYSVIIPLALLMWYAMMRALAEHTSPAATGTWAQQRNPRNHWLWWLALAVLSALAVYNQYLAMFAVGSTYLYAGLILLAAGWRLVRTRGGVVFMRDFFRRSAGMWLSFVLFVLLLAPWLPAARDNFIGRQLVREGRVDAENITLTADFVHGIFLDLSGGDALLLATAALALAAIVITLLRKDGRTALMALVWFAPVFVVVALVEPRRFPSRYVIHLLPFYLLLVAQGIALIAEGIGRMMAPRVAFKGAAAAAGAMTLALVLLAGLELSDLYRGAQSIFRGKRTTELLLRAHWREIAAQLAREVAAGDFVVFAGEGMLRPPRFLAPYLPPDFAERAHGADPTSLDKTTVWWVGIALEPKDVVTTAGTDAPPITNWEETGVARQTRAVRFERVPLANASFEEGMDDSGAPRGWERIDGGASSALALDGARKSDGAASLYQAAPLAAKALLQSAPFPVVPGALFRATMRVRNVAEGLYTYSPRLALEVQDASGKKLIYPVAPVLLPGEEDGWQTLVLDGALPAQAATARLGIEFDPTASNASWVDDVQLYLEQVP